MGYANALARSLRLLIKSSPMTLYHLSGPYLTVPRSVRHSLYAQAVSLVPDSEYEGDGLARRRCGRAVGAVGEGSPIRR